MQKTFEVDTRILAIYLYQLGSKYDFHKKRIDFIWNPSPQFCQKETFDEKSKALQRFDLSSKIT